METMTKKRIEAMQILDSENSIRFLFDNTTNMYVVFNGRLNASHYTKSYQLAESFYKQLITITQQKNK
jgi:hypothetical protein